MARTPTAQRPPAGGPGTRWPASPHASRFLRTVSERIELVRHEIVTLGVTAHVTLGWSTDHRAVIVRCLVLRSGVPDEREREAAAFAGGYLARALADLHPRLQWPGAGQNLVIAVPEEEYRQTGTPPTFPIRS